MRSPSGENAALNVTPGATPGVTPNFSNLGARRLAVTCPVAVATSITARSLAPIKPPKVTASRSPWGDTAIPAIRSGACHNSFTRGGSTVATVE